LGWEQWSLRHLPYLLTNVFHATTTAVARKIPFTVRLSFYIGATAFFGAVLWWPTRGRPTEARCELSGAADLYDDQRRSRGAGSCAQVAARLQDFPRPFFYDEITEGGYGEGADKEQEARTDAEYFTYLMMKLMDSTGSGQ